MSYNSDYDTDSLEDPTELFTFESTPRSPRVLQKISESKINSLSSKWSARREIFASSGFVTPSSEIVSKNNYVIEMEKAEAKKREVRVLCMYFIVAQTNKCRN
jgi:hypothetical protein